MDTLTYKLPSGESALFDSEDSIIVTAQKWFKSPQGYALARPPTGSRKRQTITMHGYLMAVPKGVCIDHINGNKLDNRKDNLRYCDQSENGKNARKKSRNGVPTSKHKGVSWSNRGYWQVVVRVEGKLKFIGKFDSESDAAKYAEPYFKTQFHLNGVSNLPQRDV